MTQGVGTACWLSPEVICHAHFSKHSDVYAFGIILWEVFTRSDVYVGLSAAQIISKVCVCFCFILFRLFEIVCCGHMYSNYRTCFYNSKIYCSDLLR